MKKKIWFMLFLMPAAFLPVRAAETAVNWPLHNVNLIKSDNYGWSEKFYGYSENRLYVFFQKDSKTFSRELRALSIKPELAKYFPLIDVDVIVVWSNAKKKLEILIFDKNDKFIESETIQPDGRVDDLQIRFGQGRRPALLFIKNARDENKVSLWFDDREQTIFLESARISAGALDWTKLSAYAQTREGTKPVIKVWKKGIESSYELPFSPVFAKFVDIRNEVHLLAVDGKSALWSFRIENQKLKAGKLLFLKELPYIKDMNIMFVNNNPALILHSPFNKKLFVMRSFNFTGNNDASKAEVYSLLDSNDVLPGKISGKPVWLETGKTNYTYMVNPEGKTSPIVDLNWKVETKAGYPEAFFSWDSLPQNKKFEYRYVVDDHPDSLPLPEFRLKDNKFSIKLAAEGEYYLHIQAKDPANESLSVVYHFPVFWKYRPAMPNIYLSNEITPYVVTGKGAVFVIGNLEPIEYFAEINNIPVYEPARKIDAGSGEVQINREFKPGRYYVHIRSRDPKTNTFSPTLHYLFFYQTYVTEFTVGAAEYSRDLGRLNSLVNQYKNAQSMDEKEKILKELDAFKKELENEITK